MTLGERMKEYEKVSRGYLMKRTPVVIRLDGCHFHTFTRGLNKPYDKTLMKIMQQTMQYLCENIQGCVLGYTQSDEITLVLVDYQNLNTSAWYDNQIQKICSVAASLTTLAFNKYWARETEDIYDNYIFSSGSGEQEFQRWKLFDKKNFEAIFDARVFNLSPDEVVNNLIWRQQDATRNSINLLGQSLYSHKELQGISANQLQNKMLVEKNVNWNNEPTSFKRGSCCRKNENGKWFIDNEIPIFTEDRQYIANLLII